MSSKNAVYESSIFCAFRADVKLVDSCFTMAGAKGLAAIVMVECKALVLLLGQQSPFLLELMQGPKPH